MTQKYFDRNIQTIGYYLFNTHVDIGIWTMFFYLKRIKTLMKGTMSEDRLNALTVLLPNRKKFIPDFANKVIDAFSAMKNRRMDFMYENRYLSFFLCPPYLIIHKLPECTLDCSATKLYLMYIINYPRLIIDFI